MDFKINGLLCVIVLTIKLINGQGDNNGDQKMQKTRVPPLKSSSPHIPLSDVTDMRLVLSNVEEPGSVHDQQQLKYIVARPKPDSPYSTFFVAEWSYGVVPYYIDGNAYDETLKRRIQKAMNTVEESSCVIFKEQVQKPVGSPVSWLHFTNPKQQRECSHNTKRGEDNDIIIVLGIECLKTRDLLHSVLHGVGFMDEVSHPHRDQYIRILWENVQPKYRPLFRARVEKPPFKLVEYDPMSIMHFHDRAYSENGGLTIVPVMPGLAINPSDKLSQLDVMKLRLAFGHECNKRKVGDLMESCKQVLFNQNADSKTDEEINENKDDNQQSDPEVNDRRQLKPTSGNDNKGFIAKNDNQELKLNNGGDNKLLADPDINYLRLKNKTVEKPDPTDFKLRKDEIVEGVREGRRDYPLHLWKYNTQRLH